MAHDRQQSFISALFIGSRRRGAFWLVKSLSSSSPVGAGDALSPSRVVGAGVARGGGAGDARGGGAGDALEAGAVSLVGARSSLPSMYLMAASIRVPGRGVCLLSQLTNLKKKREQS